MTGDKKVADMDSQLNTCKGDKMKRSKMVFVEACKKCGKEFEAITEAQAKSNAATHELYCDPSQTKNGKV
jgi:hypothetical protein